MKSKSSIFPLTLCIALAVSLTLPVCGEEEPVRTGIDVAPYLGVTVAQLYESYPKEVWEEVDPCSGRDFLTDGSACFFYTYYYTGETKEECTINRIVLNHLCGMDYRIDKLPGGPTHMDEIILLQTMGYELILQTKDFRNIWQDDGGHLIIVTGGKWAGACEVDYSQIVPEDEWYY